MEGYWPLPEPRYNFFVDVHLDRFEALAMMLEGLPVRSEPYSAHGEVVLVYVSGEATVTRKLDRALNGVRPLLASPLVEDPEVFC